MKQKYKSHISFVKPSQNLKITLKYDLKAVYTAGIDKQRISQHSDSRDIGGATLAVQRTAA